MADTSREKWIEVLEAVAQRRPDEAEAEWAWLMKELGLGAEYFLAIYEAVQQGRWREAENPAGYIKKVAMREARRGRGSMGRLAIPDFGGGEHSGSGQGSVLGDGFGSGRGSGKGWEITVSGLDDGNGLSGEDMLDALEYRQDSEKPIRDGDGVWRAGHGWGAAYGDPIRTETRHAHFRPGKPGRPLPDIRKPGADEPYIETEPEPLPNWAEWSQRAGLSDWEKKVVEYKMRGMGWVAALAEQPDDESRRALQAAWKKLVRTGLARLRLSAKKSFPQDVREPGGNDTD